jgi:dihydrofolate synthase/folylpolyglutamate synthase
VPVITATTAPAALAVIEKIAHEKSAPLTIVAADVNPRLNSKMSGVLSRGTATLALAGDHQKINAATALATVEILQRKISVSAAAIQTGLASVNWPGRLQTIQRPGGQKILLDGAHNSAGATALRAALETEFSGVCPVIIFGALADKKWAEICNILATVASKVFTVPVASDRTADATELARAFRAAKPELVAVARANLAEALSACHDDACILITGSLYLVGEALEQLGFSPADTGERGLNDWNAPKSTG